jgi:hypothetical protein
LVREDDARHLEDDGWELIRREPIEARRDRGERSEKLFATENSRLRYTRTRLVVEEQFSLVHAGIYECRVVSRTQEETTVTTDVIEGRLVEAIAAVLRAAG